VETFLLRASVETFLLRASVETFSFLAIFISPKVVQEMLNLFESGNNIFP
jgi:hypothetical protein